MIKKKKFHLWITLSIILLAVLGVFLTYYEKYTQVFTQEIESTEPVGEIITGDLYEQNILCDKNGLKSIQLKLATYNRLNNCTLSVSLFRGGEFVQKWDVNCIQLRDNSYYTFLLDDVIKDSSGEKYKLRIESEASEDNAITIYKNTTGEFSGLSKNNESLPGESLCYRLQYIN